MAGRPSVELSVLIILIHMPNEKWMRDLPPAFERIESMKEEVFESVEDIEHSAWELHDSVRGLRVAVGRLFAAQSDYGNTPR